VYEPDELAAVSAVVERHGGRVFSDEIHAPLVYPGHRHVPYASLSPATAAHTVTATSASKAWNLPGLKCAQILLTSQADIAAWESVGMLTSHGASTPGTRANTAAYRGGGDWLAEIVGYLDGNRRLLGELLAEHLPDIGYSQPEGTYLAWLDCRSTGLGDSPAPFFRDRAGVVFNDGPTFGLAGRGHVRLNFATPRPVLAEIVRRMAAALHDLS
jgi:cystathionine beta-lyase